MNAFGFMCSPEAVSEFNAHQEALPHCALAWEDNINITTNESRKTDLTIGLCSLFMFLTLDVSFGLCEHIAATHGPEHLGNGTLQSNNNLKDWIDQEQTRKALIDPRHCELMAVTLNLDVPGSGDALPLPWHWGWFNDALPAGALGRDGHPKKGGFLPPVLLPRRMWAGGEITAYSPIIIGKEITRRSTIESIREKSGRTGALCIITVRHELYDDKKRCVVERQNLVYREDPKQGHPSPGLIVPPSQPDIQKHFTPDPVVMFRYSALTFNGHRVHYDVEYARDVEGYPGLVFHAPLTATLLYQLVREHGEDEPKNFVYRATTPLFCNEQITLCGKREDGKFIAWAENPGGSQAMIAEANFQTRNCA